MKKAFLLAALLIGILKTEADLCHEVHIGPRVGIFVAESKLFRDIYGCQPFYGIETTCELFNNFHWWGDLDFLYSAGESIPLKNKTTLLMFPLGTGVSYHNAINDIFTFILGAGGSVNFVRLKYFSPYLPPITKKTVFGAVGKLAILGEYKWFYSSCYIDYYYQRMPIDNPDSVEESSTDIGGFLIGISFGARF